MSPFPCLSLHNKRDLVSGRFKVPLCVWDYIFPKYLKAGYFLDTYFKLCRVTDKWFLILSIITHHKIVQIEHFNWRIFYLLFDFQIVLKDPNICFAFFSLTIISMSEFLLFVIMLAKLVKSSTPSNLVLWVGLFGCWC